MFCLKMPFEIHAALNAFVPRRDRACVSLREKRKDNFQRRQQWAFV